MLAFTLAVILLIITPGPAVLSLAGVGASYGCKNATKFLFGLWIGNTLVSVAVILGFAALVLADPMVRAFLALVSATYLLYLALRIAFAGARVAFIQMDAPGITNGITLQLINPKAYAVHSTLFGGFLIYPDNFIFETCVKLLVSNLFWILFHFGWLYAGVFVNNLDLPAKTQRAVNSGMAISLIVVVAMSVWSISKPSILW